MSDEKLELKDVITTTFFAFIGACLIAFGSGIILMGFALPWTQASWIGYALLGLLASIPAIMGAISSFIYWRKLHRGWIALAALVIGIVITIWFMIPVTMADVNDLG